MGTRSTGPPSGQDTMDISQKVVWNLYSTVVAVGAAAVTKKAVESAWEFVTGEEPPEPNDPDVPTGQAIAWVVAVAVGAVHQGLLAVADFIAIFVYCKALAVAEVLEYLSVLVGNGYTHVI